MNASKSILIKGNLNGGTPKYRVCPSNEFANGRWSVACASISFNATTQIELVGSVSTNFCVNHRFSKEGQVEMYQEPLAIFQISLKENANNVTRNFNPIWLEMNSLSGINIIKLKKSMVYALDN